jgi:hypothetical protein
MQSNTLAKEIVYHQESLPNNGGSVISSPLDATDSVALTNTTPIKDRVIHFKNIDREPKIQEREIGWWIGKVTAIREETFDAVMEDLSGNVNVVELEKELIDPHEQDLLFINSKFTYAISRIDKPDGREYKTKFSFSSRRKWLKEYEIEAKRLADQYFPDSLLSL